MTSHRCCAHCPGKLVLSGSNESHDCCQPNYVTGNLRVSSLQKQVPNCGKEDRRSMRQSVEPTLGGPTSCYDKFALAKRLHAENLEHQPLPDRVDDSVFKKAKPQKSCRRTSTGKCRCIDHHEEETGYVDRRTHRYGPVLGCKKPETRMDLAICWETPISPTYEPRRPTHIDGSEGGLAPAVFALVQHTPNSTRACIQSTAGKLENPESKQCTECLCYTQEAGTQTNSGEKKNGVEENPKNVDRAKLSKQGCDERSRSQRRYRKCVACDEKERKDDPRLIKSAVGLALGMQKSDTTHPRNGLPPKTIIPRPRTPFARRSFCIDTLAPPFSVVNGCRDADYPEHWRLMSIYQQSYKNPRKRRTVYHC